jgi:hypothetical protein
VEVGRAEDDEVTQGCWGDDREEPVIDAWFLAESGLELVAAAQVRHYPDHGRKDAVLGLFVTGVPVVLVLQGLADDSAGWFGLSVDFEEPAVLVPARSSDEGEVGLQTHGLTGAVEIRPPGRWFEFDVRDGDVSARCGIA